MKQTKTSVTLETASVALKYSPKQWEYLPILLKINSWLLISANMFDICSVLTLCACGGRCSSVPISIVPQTLSLQAPSSFPCQQHFQPSCLQQLTLWDRMVPLWGSTQCPCNGLGGCLEAIADQHKVWKFIWMCAIYIYIYLLAHPYVYIQTCNLQREGGCACGWFSIQNMSFGSGSIHVNNCSASQESVWVL